MVRGASLRDRLSDSIWERADNATWRRGDWAAGGVVTWELGREPAVAGQRRAHLRRYLDAYVFRFNGRRHTRAAFDGLVGLAKRLPPATDRDIVDPQV